jgi:hypothetical protein
MKEKSQSVGARWSDEHRSGAAKGLLSCQHLSSSYSCSFFIYSSFLWHPVSSGLAIRCGFGCAFVALPHPLWTPMFGGRSPSPLLITPNLSWDVVDTTNPSISRAASFSAGHEVQSWQPRIQFWRGFRSNINMTLFTKKYINMTPKIGSHLTILVSNKRRFLIKSCG